MSTGSPAQITMWHNLLCCIWKWIQNVFKVNSIPSKCIMYPTTLFFSIIHNVVVVQLSLALCFVVLLWCSSCSFCDSQCCWGTAPARFAICNVAVVKLLLIFDLFETCNVAVVTLLLVLWFAALLWWSSCSFCNSQCCCGWAPAHFVICNIAVVKLLLVLWFAMLFWTSSYSL